MIKEMILNSFAKCLSKRDREAKYPFNIFIDDDLGKRYLEKVMAVVSLHYENWEV